MPLVPDSPEQDVTPIALRERRLSFAFLRLPRNVYILLCFTPGKGFQLRQSLNRLRFRRVLPGGEPVHALVFLRQGII